jgi:signal transduction histidine kinase/ActR/RegA family two-component response regulator
MWLAGGAFVMGTGIWSMHFIGMLAWSVPVSLSYSVSLVILSAILAILGSGFALWIVSVRSSGTPPLLLATPFMGAAIAGMHYTGMAGLRGSFRIEWNPLLVAASVAVALIASYSALWLAFRFKNTTRAGVKKLTASVVMGLAVVGMHYTAMAAVHPMHRAALAMHGGVLPTSGLAVAVTAITFVILGMAAVMSTIDRQLSSTTSLAAENERLYRAAAAEIAERKRAEAALKASEEQLRQSQRIEAVGRLAGGIAHDFNNLLTTIGGHTELLLAETPETDHRRDDVVQIGLAAERAASLTRQLLAFSRKQVLTPKVLNLNSCIAATERMLRRVIGDKIVVTTELAEDLDAVRADGDQIEQVLINLIVNARDAMPDGGTLHIRTTNSIDCMANAARPLQGRYVLLIVSDTGCGMDASIASHIFDPYFTTKDQGTGAGLGLSTVYGIVTQSEGRVWVDTAPGAGSTFYICLPGVDHELPVNRVTSQELLQRDGSETVLLVEDEDPVRALAAKVLTRRGYNVLEAADIGDAIRIAYEHQDPIDLVLTDVVMPIMNGPELAALIAEIRPGIRVLYMSGYMEDSILNSATFEERAGFLSKPFTVDGLARKVREVLDSTLQQTTAHSHS